MIFKQMFDTESSTYTYLLADEAEQCAVLIDPVSEHLEIYLNLLKDSNLKLVAAIDTHVHADHVTALGELRQTTGATTYLGSPGDVECADRPLRDGDKIRFGKLELSVIFTPGHTDDSYCFLLNHDNKNYLFTGDTLLIGGTGRTDFQNGDPSLLYDSLHQKLLTLPNDTLIYPGHDYHGKKVSTIGDQKQTNTRIRIQDKATFIDFMNKLDLPNPKQMDIAVPANKGCGVKQGISFGN